MISGTSSSLFTCIYVSVHSNPALLNNLMIINKPGFYLEQAYGVYYIYW